MEKRAAKAIILRKPPRLQEAAMATILPFMRDGAFDPKDIQAMSMALDDVCISLNIHDGPAREVLAERIITLARGGVRSPTILRDRVLMEAGLTGIDGKEPSPRWSGL
jgi:hypothetical protein